MCTGNVLPSGIHALLKETRELLQLKCTRMWNKLESGEKPVVHRELGIDIPGILNIFCFG